jgi:AbrB family looped-hinge helix DNA binding protein
MTTMMTTKGQVTVPKRVRDMLGIGPGARVAFELLPGGQVRLMKADSAPPLDRFARLLGSAGSGMSTDEIMALTRGDSAA